MQLGKYLMTYMMLMGALWMNGQAFYKVIGTSGADYAEAVINDRDSGFVIVGGTAGLGQGELDGYMLKLDTAGNIIWTRTFGFENVDKLTGVAILDDGFLLCGYSNIEGNYDLYIIRTNEAGQVVWEKTLGNDNWEFPQALSLVNDTTAVIVGKVLMDGSTSTDAFICSISTDGDSLWSQYYGGVGDDVLERVILSDSAQIYVCGSYEVDDNDSDYWVGRIDGQGDFLWELFLGDTLNDYGHGITELITGEFVITGEDDDGAGTNIDNVFYKIDSNGNILYQNILNNPNDDIGWDVISYPDTNSFILVSRSSSVGLGGFDTWVFDCSYNTYGAGNFSYDFGTSQDEWVMDADTTFDKGLITVGDMWDPVLGNAIFVHKTNIEQNAMDTYQTDEDLEVELKQEQKLVIYPNPVNNVINLKSVHPSTNMDYQLLNLSGQVIQSGRSDGDFISVDLESGCYFLLIEGQVRKFVVQHD